MSATTPPLREGATFSDARTCKEWLGALPLTNIPQAQYLVLEALRGLAKDEAFDPLERLKCLELVRDKAAYLQAEQRTRYFGKSLPLHANDTDAWKSGRSLLEELEAGYRQCLEAAAGGGEIAQHQALVAQRIVRYLGAQMLFHALIYRRFDPQLWQRLHAMYQRAEAAGIADEIVKDTLEGEEGTSSVAEAYVRVVLLQAAYLSEVTAPQMEYIEHLIRMWIRRIVVRRKAEGAGALAPLVVDLSKAIGARPHLAAEVGDSQRVLDVEHLSKSLRKRIHGLQNGEDAATLGLPAQVPVNDQLDQLKRVHRLWCEGAPPRPPAKVPQEKGAGLVFGLTEIWFFITGGKAFEQPDKKRELTQREKQDIEVFGRITERTHATMVGEINYQVENWGVVDEMLGAWRLMRPSTSSRSLTIGRLVAMRVGDTAPFFLGKVSALSQEPEGVIATVTLFPGKPEAIPVRAGDARNRANAQWSQGFRLPAMEKARLPASMVVGAGVAGRGRGVEVWDGAPHEHTVEEILDHGTDFDRVSYF
jgi:hypothetical protein